MVNGYTLPQNAMQHDDCCVVNFWRVNKNSANWCVQQSWGIPRKTANLMLLNLNVLLKLTYFLVKSASDNLENKICKNMIYLKLQEPTFKLLHQSDYKQSLDNIKCTLQKQSLESLQKSTYWQAFYFANHYTMCSSLRNSP